MAITAKVVFSKIEFVHTLWDLKSRQGSRASCDGIATAPRSGMGGRFVKNQKFHEYVQDYQIAAALGEKR